MTLRIYANQTFVSQFHVYFQLVILKSERIFVWSFMISVGKPDTIQDLQLYPALDMEWTVPTQKVNYFKMYDGKCLRTVQFSR